MNIVFETSILVSENFPDISIDLKQFFETANILKLDLYIPKIVLRELEQLYIENVFKQINQINKSYKELKPYAQEQIFIKLPDVDYLISVYEKNVMGLLEKYNIKVIEIPSLITNDLIEKAIKYIPPFKKDDKGFKDALILESILLHASNNRLNSIILVSGDKIFNSGEIKEYAEKSNINLIIMESLEQVKDYIYQFIDKALREMREQEEKKAISALTLIRDDIDIYLKDNLEISSIDIFDLGLSGTLQRITNSKLKNIISAAVDKKDGKVRISFKANVELILLVESFPRGILMGKVYKIGEEKTLTSTLSSSGSSLQEQIIDIQIRGEAEADLIDNNYQNIKIVSITFLPKSHSLFSSFDTWREN